MEVVVYSNFFGIISPTSTVHRVEKRGQKMEKVTVSRTGLLEQQVSAGSLHHSRHEMQGLIHSNRHR